jgi:hypothetical protein
MKPAEKIRDAMTRIEAMRDASHGIAQLETATTAVKRFQSRRFSGTYRDLLASAEYSEAAYFFLTELYSEKDYSQRDVQFARIAGALQRLFPAQVVATAVALAELHMLTEELDHQMAQAWLDNGSNATSETGRYLEAWTAVGRAADRKRQLDLVLHIGKELIRLTRTPGLRFMLKMMRRPATATGLGALQGFLESGFDTFANMAGAGERAKAFLNTIHQRESQLLEILFFEETASAEFALNSCLASSR